jgi:transposase
VDVVHERCCGLDIHKKRVVACAIVPGDDGQPRREVRTFGTMTAELLELGDWLDALGVTHAAMESTSVYWKPLYNLLEDRFSLLLVNAQHVKRVPGRKTDVKDCEWLADLLRHGLLQPSYVPDRPQRELRELTRYRTSLVRERSAEVNRLQKTLEGANIKLASVASNVVGSSGRLMLERLVRGSTDAAALAELAKGRLREKIPQLEQALAGRIGDHQRFLLARQLAHLDQLSQLIDEVGAEIRRRLRALGAEGPEQPTGPPGFAEAAWRLQTLPGVGQRTAEVLVAEIGVDMRRFPTAGHLASWTGLCPGNHESAGKRLAGKTRRGSPWLRAALVEAAQVAARMTDTYFAAFYRRVARRRGTKRAIVAVAHSLLVAAYHMLRRGADYQELGADYFERRDREALVRASVRRLEGLGLKVTLEPTSPAA